MFRLSRALAPPPASSGFRAASALAILVSAAVLAGLHWWGGFGPLSRAVHDSRFAWSGRDPTGQVVIVDIDDRSLAEIGTWPWPRTVHATLVDNLRRSGAAQIAFDVDFSSKGVGDDELEQALERAGGSVVLAAFRRPAQAGSAELAVTRPLPRFESKAWSALVDVYIDQDGGVRAVPLQVHAGHDVYPAFSAMLAGGSGSVPLLIDYSIRPERIDRISAADLLDLASIDPARLRGRIVIIGSTATALGDFHHAPGYSTLPGPIVQALATETLLQKRGLTRPHAAVVPLLLALLALVGLVALGRLSLGKALLSLLVLAASIEAALALVQVRTTMSVDSSALHLQLTFFAGLAVVREMVSRQSLWRSAAQERRKAQALLDRVVEDNVSGIIVADRDGRILAASRAAPRLLRLDDVKLVGRDAADVLPPAIAALFSIASDGATDAAGTLELGVPRADGGKRILDYTVSYSRAEAHGGEPGEIEAVCCTFADVTERQRTQERLAWLARHDAGTGLYNRNGFLEMLARTCASGQRADLVIADLDHFRRVNEAYGQRWGDEAIRALARRVAALAPEGGTVARIGGDSFALIAPGEGGEALVQSVLAAIRMPLDIGQHRIEPGASCAVARIEAGLHPDEALRRAELALEAAKTDGGNAIRFYTDALDEALRNRERLQEELQVALAENQFELAFQPQCDLATGEIVGAEALLRWNHPVRGLVPPQAFIPVAEETGLIVQIGQWVLHKACEAALTWPPRLQLAVNVAAPQLTRGDFVSTLWTVLAETGLPATRLEVELTETMLFSDDAAIRQSLLDLRDFGTGLALDDFGTGYCSLSYIQRFPITKVKLDRSFLQGLPGEPQAVAIVQAVATIARALDLVVVAEGIETEAQAHAAHLLGCDVAQGYLYGRPMSAADFAMLVTTREAQIPARATA
jgi:diguanylate cyclase (GGDEF)-like protein/PAS domain S-box-containing protein